MTPPRVPSAEEFCPFDHREIQWGECGRCKDLKDYARAVLEAAAEVADRCRKDGGVSYSIAANIRALKEDL